MRFLKALLLLVGLGLAKDLEIQSFVAKYLSKNQKYKPCKSKLTL